MQKKYLLFDLDGTLMDSKKSVIESTYEVSEIFDSGKYTYKETEDRFGEFTDNFLRELSGEFNEIKARYMNIIREKKSSPFESVKENLEFLYDQGYTMGIVTNKQKDLAIEDLERNDLISYFKEIVSVDDVKEGKPAPDMIHHAVNLLGADYKDVVLIGDSIFDEKAAINSKIDFIMLDWYKEFNDESYKCYTNEIGQVSNIFKK